MHIDWTGLGQVLGVSLVLGAGVVTLFSAGIAIADRGHRVVPAVSFLACAALVAYGICLVALH
ncbi:hypothetical protein FXN61_41195 [Lentzea sp. PSKA42]|uniref:Uncharacterized protein n=1 Tax=Lentzea indica TaxID=2604800 RepID=A0ABX1FUT5_9PSEU|nr:hypothetical protein [Lentzea indica]